MPKYLKNILIYTIPVSILLLFLIWINLSYSNQPIWSISIYNGKSPCEISTHPQIGNRPIITASDVDDVLAIFVADPFMVKDNGLWYLFFEVLNGYSKNGDIGLASSKNGIDWEYQQIVLDESFHLSYPYVFKNKDTYYMIPESRHGKAVKLYKSVEFPTKWVFVTDLISGNFADPSIVHKNGIWYLFVLKGYDTLSLYYASNLAGPWNKHPSSPLVKGDRECSRSGGRIIFYNDKMYRYVQDGVPTYANAIKLFQVDSISTEYFKDHEIIMNPVLEKSGNGWNSNGMHHVDPHQTSETNWIACVDGHEKKSFMNYKYGTKLFLFRIKNIVNIFK